MVNQLLFELPVIDEKATRINVESVLEKYLLYKTIEFEEKEASITPSYQFRYHGPTNVTSDQTANVAIDNVDEPEKRKRYCEWVEKSVSRLSFKQRQLIIERYMKETDIFDYEVYDGILEISVKKYCEIRERAFYTLAFIMKVYVKKE